MAEYLVPTGTLVGWSFKVSTQAAYNVTDHDPVSPATPALEDIEAGRSTVFLTAEDMFKAFGIDAS